MAVGQVRQAGCGLTFVGVGKRGLLRVREGRVEGFVNQRAFPLTSPVSSLLCEGVTWATFCGSLP